MAATSLIYYEKVDPQFLQLPLLVDLQGTWDCIKAIDDYRIVIAIQIESIGKR